MSEAFVGRQAIYKADLAFFAYELLVRKDEHEQSATIADGDSATAEVLLNTFMSIGLDQVVGQNLAFVNLTRMFIQSDYCSLLPKDRVVLEILEDVAPDPAVIEAVKKLAAQGYTIALDDFTYTDKFKALVDLADIIKVDVLQHDHEGLAKQVEMLRKFKVRLLAEKVETHEDYEYCKQLGFDYFQGYFFCKPHTVSAGQVPANRLAMVRLLAALHDPDISPSEVERLVRQDLAVSYKLLRFVNSSGTAVSRQIDSIQHAVGLVGTRRICDWVSLMLLADIEDKPRELMIIAMVRARMCELLAQAMQQKNSEQFFTSGLFSVLEALLDRPMREALESLALSPDVKAALVDGTGLMGEVLSCVLNYERAKWDEVRCGTSNAATVWNSYLKAVDWTRNITTELSL